MMSKLILVTGATGYIASRLIPRLLEQGYRVRVLARRPAALQGRKWLSSVETAEGEVTQPANLAAALQGVQTAYYLIHNMASGRGYTQLEAEGARNFASAAERAGTQQIIYLGGLADPNDRHLAAHLRSRIETGNLLLQGSVPVTEFRAGVIAGAGSISFEMIRFMTELFPIIWGPAWLKNRSQPIAAQNVIDYLVAALGDPQGFGRVFEIGGPDVLAYGELMLKYARLRGLKRRLVTLPRIPLGLMAWGVGLLTPVSSPIAYALIAGLAEDSLVKQSEALQTYPGIDLLDFGEATKNALAQLSPACVERVWEGLEPNASNFKHEGFFVDHRRLEVQASAEKIYSVLTSMGGAGGWPFANWVWKLRGWLDRRLGGQPAGPAQTAPGIRQGARVDYYRVEALEPNQLLRLRAELRAPGDGWMEWRIDPGPGSSQILHQTAFFAPRGFPGFLYWFALYPVHSLVFHGLLKAIAAQAQRNVPMGQAAG